MFWGEKSVQEKFIIDTKLKKLNCIKENQKMGYKLCIYLEEQTNKHEVKVNTIKYEEE